MFYETAKVTFTVTTHEFSLFISMYEFHVPLRCWDVAGSACRAVCCIFNGQSCLFSVTLNFDCLCNIRVVNSCISVTQIPSSLPSSSPNSYIEGEFH